MVKTLGLTTIGLCMGATTASEFGSPLWIQYGALGLAGVMVVFLCKFVLNLIDRQSKERTQLLMEISQIRNEADMRMAKLIDKNTSTFERLAKALEGRPCLAEDKTIRE